MAFAHLHLHTEYSLLDGANRIGPLVSRLKELGFTHAAITDHGVMYGAVDFYNACRDAGITPVIGCEVYICRNRFEKSGAAREYSHMILLCENNTGYQNLIKLVSAGFTEGFYYKPRIDYELLKQHTEGLICLSACLSGDLPKMLLEGRYDDAKAYALQMQELFGKDHYYIELMDHGIPEEKTVLPRLVRVAQETGVPMVVTNDCHYLNREDAAAQEVLMCIQTGKTLQDETRMRMNTEELYVKSEAEMRAVFPNFPEAIENSQKIAERCHVTFDFGHLHLPHYPIDTGETAEEMLRRLCGEGLKALYPDEWDDPASEPCQRLEYELSVISHMGYVDYFLIVWDFINYAKSHGIMVGPGRGSGAGSIVAYTLRITMLDPLKYSLLFERFLNPERVSMPDLDIDFCYERRQEVIDYVNEKYGRVHVAQIVTFGTMAARAAVRDVGRVMGMGYQDVDRVAKLIPTDLKMTLKKALEVSPDLKALYDADTQVHDLIDTSLKVEGMPRHASTHAAGVVITRDPATEYVPLSTNDGLPVTQFNMVEIERLGLLKMDFLGLRTLTVIHDTETAVRRKYPDFRVADIDYDDPDTYAMLARGETEGIFQLESTGMTQVLTGMRPKNLEDIIALISLYRPGPMDSIPTYLRNRKDPSKVSYKTPQMAHIVDVTNGVVIYQEQVMQICRELAGFSFGQADNVRRAMSKKKLKVMEAEREHFVHGCKEPGKECAGCVANGVPENIANEIYDDMISFASYAFNKSHAACYAYVAFQTAYLKCHYPHEFMAALLTSVLDNTSKVIEYTTECQRLGIKVQQPDINVSRGGFTADGERIRFGLNAVKSVGRDLIEAVIKERAERPYSSLYDFCKRLHGTGLNRRALENLVKAGAFDTLEPTRHGMLESVEGILKSVETDARQNLDGQMDLFGLMGGGEDEKPANDYKVPNLPEYSASDLLKMEKEVSGLYLSGHPLDAYRAQIAQVSTCTIAQLLGEDAKQFDNQTVTLVCTIVKNKIMTTKSNTLMAFTTVEDLTGSMELLVFPRILAECRAALQENAVVVANGRVSVKEDEAARLIVEGVQPIETYDPGKNFGMNRVERVKRETSGGGAAGYFLTVPSRDSAQMHKVENLLCNIFDGGTVRVYFRFQDTGRAMLARHMAVKDDPLLRAELERILGKDCVKVQDIEHSAK